LGKQHGVKVKFGLKNNRKKHKKTTPVAGLYHRRDEPCKIPGAKIGPRPEDSIV
jgi:hypothetical protein